MKQVQNVTCNVLNLTYALYMVLLVLAIACAATSPASAELTANANHDHIKIDFFYHGSTVSIRGVSDPGVDLIIKIASPEGHQALKKRGKVGGLIWMNVGELAFENVPTFYSVHSSRKLEDMLDPDEMDKYVIGYQALGKHASLSPISSPEEKDRWFNEFLKFKQASNLYATSSGKISTTMKDGKQNYYILTEWPYQAAPGDYMVTVYAVKDKRIVEQAEANVNVQQVGVVKTLSTMAKNNGALYGGLSILAALGAGFAVGMVFRKGGGAH
jgi:uncharacterized protein (TIGR02186 family)